MPAEWSTAARGLTAVELDHQVLVAPDRHKEAAGVGDPFKDPWGIAAAQTGRSKPGWE
jgi:hypothetical protein